MKTILISFANNEKWYRSQNVLNQSAVKFGIKHYISYNPSNLDKEFSEKYSHLLTPTTRGYGYWMWKSAILEQTFNIANDNDIILYIDSGNQIVSNLDYIISVCNQKEVVLFDNRDGNPHGIPHINQDWTKRDCFTLMDCDEEKYYKAPQIDASYLFFKKTSFTQSLIKEFKTFSENENIISDLPNITKPNLSTFSDHRHDQSIMSLLAAKHNIELLPEPSEWGNHLKRPYPQLFRHHRGVF